MAARQRGVEKVDTRYEDEEEEAYMTRMKNQGEQFSDEDEETERRVKAKPRRPADVVLEHANDTYTQRFCQSITRPPALPQSNTN